MKMVVEEDTVRAHCGADNSKDMLAAAHTLSVSSISVADKVCIVLNHPLTKNDSGKLFWTTIGTRRFLARAHMK